MADLMKTGFLNRMSKEDYAVWANMTPKDRKDYAKKLAAEKMEKERLEKEADSAYWQNFRKEAQYQADPVKSEPETYGIDSGEQGIGDIISEGWSEAKDTVSGLGDTISGLFSGDDEEEDVEQVEGYQGRKSDIDFINKMAEKNRIDQMKFNRGPGQSTLESAIPPPPDEGLKRPPNINPRIWDRTPPHMRRKLIENMARRDAKAENLMEGMPSITPRDQSPPADLLTAREDQVKRVKEMLARGELDPSSPEVKRILGEDYLAKMHGRYLGPQPSFYADEDTPAGVSLESADIYAGRKSDRQKYKEKLRMMLTRGQIDPNSPEVRRILGSQEFFNREGPVEELEQKEVSPELLEELDAVDKQLKEGEGLIDVSQENVQKQKDKDAITEVAIAKEEDKGGTGDFVRYDDNDYPIYKQGSKWSKSFNDAFARALEKGEEVFSWTGHDGISRQYTAERALKNAEEPTPPSDNPVTDSQMAEMTDPSDFMPVITEYEKADTKDKKEEIIKKAENKATNNQEKKAIRATIKQEADEYWVHPVTGWAINLTQLKKKIKRKEIMEFASTLPPDMAPLYYKQQGLIDQEDFDALIKDKKEKDALARKFKKLQIDTQIHKLTAAKRAAETDPQRAEHLKMFLNAGNNDNYGLQVYLGKKLGLDEKIMDLARDAHMQHEMDKLAAKKKGVGGKRLFSDRFFVDYSTVITNKQRWIDNASSIIQTTGRYANILQLDGTTKQVDRAGYFRSYGLKEHKDMLALSSNEQVKILKESPFYPRIEEIIKVDGNPPTLDPSLFLRDKDAYEMYLKNTLVYYGMKDLYGEKKYNDMLKFVENHSMPADQAMARVNKTLTK